MHVNKDATVHFDMVFLFKYKYLYMYNNKYYSYKLTYNNKCIHNYILMFTIRNRGWRILDFILWRYPQEDFHYVEVDDDDVTDFLEA